MRVMNRLVLPLALLFANLSLTALAGGIRQHPRGLYGQDEMRRSLRLLENDADALIDAFRVEIPHFDVAERDVRAVFADLLEFEDETNRLRDDYLGLDEAALAARLQEVLLRNADVSVVFRETWDEERPNARLATAWEQIRFDLRRIESILDARHGDRPGWMPMLPEENLDLVKVAVMEVEELSDNLKRHLKISEAEEEAVERKVLKKGKRRHLVVYTRFEKAILEFENAADDLKRRYRLRNGPGNVAGLIRTLERTSKLIEHNLSDVSVDVESRREWTEMRPQLALILNSDAARGDQR